MCDRHEAQSVKNNQSNRLSVQEKRFKLISQKNE